MAETSHEKRCLDVLHSTSVKEFASHLFRFAQNLGFSTVGAMVITEHSPTLTEFQSVTNAPEAFLEEFHNLDHAVIDPVLQHCKHSNSPIVWDRRDYANAHADLLWNQQEPFGYRSGIAVAMHFERGRHFMFGANWANDRCADVRHFRTIAEDLLDFGRHAQAAAFELTLPSVIHEDSACKLAAKELEALRWTMDGMASTEVALRMSISERHVALLTHRAMQKLGASTKYQAGLAAIRLGLISCS